MSPSAFNSCADEVKEPLSPRRRFLSWSVGWLITGLSSLFRILLIAWGTLAIYYSNLPWASLRLALASAFAAFAVWACWLTARRAMSAVFLVCLRVWSLGGYPSLLHMIAPGDRKSQ